MAKIDRQEIPFLNSNFRSFKTRKRYDLNYSPQKHHFCKQKKQFRLYNEET